MTECPSGKIPYETRWAAARALSAIRNRKIVRRLQPYECQWCGRFHLGNVARRRR